MSIDKSFKHVWAPLHSWRAIRQTVRVCLLAILSLSARYLTDDAVCSCVYESSDASSQEFQ